jgi:anti-sigma regulatory factor (Ser/Thr protein kinase)
LPAADQFLLGTGGTGLSFTLGPDVRITNVNNLPPGPVQLTGPTMPFDAFTGDTIHQYFQMVQQVDCAIDAEHVSKDNPTGCLHDLQSAVTTTYSTPPGSTPHDTGQTMEFFNMQNGDAPLLKSLADNYTMSDNYHQPVLGGTGPDSQPLGFADQVFFSDGKGNPVTPLPANIYNPDPQPGTLNLYKQRAQWFNCSDPSQPGIGAITEYLSALPYAVQTRCDAGAYWQAVNVNPAFTPKGTVQTGLVVPPTMQQSIVMGEIDINDAIQEVASLLSNESSRHRILMSTELAAGLPRVRGDRVQLQQVMVNLVMNAVDATRAISDGPREILIRSAKDAESVVVSVEDSGTGFTPEQLERIFEPFFTTKAQGIGMGLSISRSIVESHSGKLSASSRKPRGARFEFTLPMAGADEAASAS